MAYKCLWPLRPKQIENQKSKRKSEKVQSSKVHIQIYSYDRGNNHLSLKMHITLRHKFLSRQLKSSQIWINLLKIKRDVSKIIDFLKKYHRKAMTLLA